jgi:hypothetical protein
MEKLKEFTGILEIKLEVTLPASSKKEALELLENMDEIILLRKRGIARLLISKHCK